MTAEYRPVPARPEEPGRGVEVPGRGPGERQTDARPTDARRLGGLERAVGFLQGVARTATRLAAVALVSGFLVWWALNRGLDPGDTRIVVLVVAAILLLAPPVVLLLFVLAIRALIDVPRRIREAPQDLRDRAGEIRRRAAEVTEARRRGPLRSLVALFRLGWTVASSRELLEVAPALALFTPWMLVASVLAAIGAVLEVLLGLGAALWLAFA